MDPKVKGETTIRVETTKTVRLSGEQVSDILREHLKMPGADVACDDSFYIREFTVTHTTVSDA